MDFLSKYNNNLLTLEDQEEALTSSYWSYLFAKANIPGSNFKALQAKACEEPGYAFLFAENIPGVDIKYCQKHACKNTAHAYWFALDIPGADIKYCQEYACQSHYYAYMFALHIPKSDKEYCFKHAYPEERFGPNRWKSEYNKFIMKKACE